MSVFLDCLCDDSFFGLIISGTATDEELHANWLIILGEWHERRSNHEMSEEFQLIVDARKIRNHIAVVSACIQVLKEDFKDELVSVLRKLGYKFPKSVSFPSEYLQDLIEISDRLQSKFIELDQVYYLIGKEQAKTHVSKPSRDPFEKAMLNFEEMQKVSYSMDTITVSKFVQLEKKYQSYIERMRKWKGK